MEKEINFSAELLARVIAAISGATLTVVLARLLDPDGYGLLFFVIAVMGTVEMFTRLGLARSGARYISEYKETNPSQIRYIINTAVFYTIVAIILVSIPLLLYPRQISSFLNNTEVSNFIYVGILYISSGTLVALSRDLLQGFEAIEDAAKIHIVDRLSRLIIVIGIVLLGYGATGAFFGYIISLTIAAVYGMFLLYQKYYSKIQAREQKENRLTKRIVEYAIPLTATKAANVVDTRIDQVLVGFFLNPAAVGFYIIGKQVMTFIQTPASALGFSLAPTISSEQAKDNIEQASELYEESFVLLALLYIPGAAGIAILAGELVDVVFGQAYSQAVPVLQILTIYAILYSIMRITSNTLDYLGKAKIRAISKGATSALNFILNIIFIPVYGVTGAAVATVITFSIYASVNIITIDYSMELDSTRMFRDIMKIICITIVMSIVVIFSKQFLPDIFSLVICPIIGFAVWLVMSLKLNMLNPSILEKLGIEVPLI